MKRYFVIFPILFIMIQSWGQNSVVLRIDMADLIGNKSFLPDSGDRIFVRGSFNGWAGTDYELIRTSDPNIFSGDFNLGEIGDTVYYKFLIGKEGDHYFWEGDADPANPDNGNRELIIDTSHIVLEVTRFSCDEYIRYPVVFGKEDLRGDFRQFRQILESTHPALYDYTPKPVLDSIFDANYERIDSAMEFDDFLMLMTEVISRVGCGHTSLWVPDRYWNVAPERLFPLRLEQSGNKIWVSGSYGDRSSIPQGSEIIAINGVPTGKIVDSLAALTSADGFNPSYRRTKAVGNFSVKYAHVFGFPPGFMVDYIAPGSTGVEHAVLQPVAKDTVDKGKRSLDKLSYEVLGELNTGVLTINTFGYYGEVAMFHGFIDSVFRDIDQRGIQNLILDLRGNGGGDPFCSAYLWGYLEPEPLPYFKDHYGKYDTLANPIPIAREHFEGKLFTLIDGNGFSTTGHFCGLLKYHRVGTFIGSEMGATYTCTGNATYPALKNTGIMVGTARVRRYTAAVEGMDPMRGVMPDYPVEVTQQDILEGRDAVMSFVISLLDPP